MTKQAKAPTPMTLEEIFDALHHELDQIDDAAVQTRLKDLGAHRTLAMLRTLVLEQARRSDRERKRAAEAVAVRPEATSPAGEAMVSVVPPPTRQHGWQPSGVKPAPLSSIALIYAKEHRGHASDAFPEDSPGRVEGIVTHLKGARFFHGETKVLLDAPEATVEQLATVHSREYIEFIRTTSARGPTRLPRSTYMCAGSWQAALAAAGAALKAGDLVQQDYDAAFALTRPAGHHALPDMYGGFCLFNNAAILAKALKARGRVMVLNWDVHASNGTKHIFYTDPDVLTISIHRNPVGFFPNEGFVEEIGSGLGQGSSINVPMPVGSGDSDYLRVFEAVVRPLHSQFRPRHIIVECGFDAHHQDPIGGMRLSSQGYHLLGQGLLSLQNKGLVLTLEGGYNAKSIGMLAHSLLSSLLGLPNPVLEKGPPGEAGRSDALSYGLVKGSKGERRRGQAEPHSVDLVIEQLRHHLRQWWAL